MKLKLNPVIRYTMQFIGLFILAAITLVGLIAVLVIADAEGIPL